MENNDNQQIIKQREYKKGVAYTYLHCKYAIQNTDNGTLILRFYGKHSSCKHVCTHPYKTSIQVII